ncbi:PREDICTED: uncharacterized protein LOC103341933 isoform X2 [Prunus mume]|uniref:Uncharacterized protein LOC103341933 isoform X2 n=1 Tax=Prunus mume TaxID=102107 RepID=A0ABM1LXM8_PRUMU|nr:PREDICTED: uncharacterized protein LOC103341933 isoform X2 [Prunus mume]
MASSKKWASIISSIASCVYFLVIILQVPLFRVPCTAGICRTPIEVLAGSYLSVAGALLGLIKPGRMSLCGMLLIIWGLVREIILRKSTSTTHVYIYPAMSIALFSAFLSITKDVRRIIRSCRHPRNVKAKLF